MYRIKTYCLLATLVLLSSCGERTAVSDLGSLGLRHRVKSVDESFYLAENRFNSIVLQKKLYQYKYQFYNDCRYKSVEKKLFPCNRIFLDSIPNIVQPDSAENLFPHAFKEPGYCFINYKYLQDSVTDMETFDAYGNLISYTRRKYSNNRLLSEEKYSGHGNLISKSELWYGSDNKLQNRTVFYENRYLETDWAYSAGEKFESGNEFNYRYKFDINGRVSNKKTYKGVALASETHYYYNDYGDITLTLETDSEGMLKKTLYDYTYDLNGNWLLCVEYDSTGNIFVLKRKITYYS
jgi:hypothetical protein